jgi:adenosylcobinamide-GDP ribazoletransferase
MTGLGSAVTFLTRVPMRPATPLSPEALPWFPVVGAVLGLVAAAVHAAGYLVAAPLLAAALAVATTVLLTGALHEDGLADAADAWGGASTREAALRILRDPRHGTYGVLALVLSVGLRVAALASLPPTVAITVLSSVHAISRGALVPLLWASPPARPDGLASRLAGQVPTLTVVLTALATVAIGVVLLAVWVVPAVIVTFAIVTTVRWLAMRRIGGITGDVLGAAQQLVEVALLVMLAAASR